MSKQVDISSVKINAPFEHPVLGPMWITKKSKTHVSFYAQYGARRFSRVKLSLQEFRTGNINPTT